MDTTSMLPVGTLLQSGKYRVESYLASGGFGNTYIIINVQFGKSFVLKEFFIRGVSERDENQTTVSISNMANSQLFTSQLEKFKKEARRMFDLNDKHLVRVHDLFEENGTAYYVMDLIEGDSLSTIQKQRQQPFAEQEVIRILNQMIDALREIHRHKIWHLDLKPSNILMDRNGNVVLIDFGASKQMGTGGYTTTTGSMCYTPGYAPLEQVDQNIMRIGPWTDIYALGATLYYLLTGNKPPTNSELHEPDAFRFPPTVSEKMRKLVVWMMNPVCTERPQSVDDIRDYLLPKEETEHETIQSCIQYEETTIRERSVPMNNNISSIISHSLSRPSILEENTKSIWISAFLLLFFIFGLIFGGMILVFNIV